MKNQTSFMIVSNITKRYGNYVALHGVSFCVEKGQAIALIGPSCSGKSTLLRCINALERIDEGEVSIDGEIIGSQPGPGVGKPLSAKVLARQRESIGMVFQSFNLFPHMTALENISSGPRLVRGEAPPQAALIARTLLGRVGLADKAGAYPRQLSGGQLQRVAIARALAMKPKVMLFDEPTSALDPETVQEVLNVIREVRDSGMTMLIATHEMEFARFVSDRTLFMEAGKIVEQGASKEIFERPETERCRKFLSGMTREAKRQEARV